MFAQNTLDHSPTKTKTHCPNIIGLYQAIDSTIEASHNIQTLPPNDSLERMKLRAWYYNYVHPQWMDEAIHMWVEFRSQNNISIPVGLDDELAIIFYLYICHDTDKEQVLESILENISAPELIKVLRPLCNEENIIIKNVSNNF